MTAITPQRGPFLRPLYNYGPPVVPFAFSPCGGQGLRRMRLAPPAGTSPLCQIKTPKSAHFYYYQKTNTRTCVEQDVDCADCCPGSPAAEEEVAQQQHHMETLATKEVSYLVCDVCCEQTAVLFVFSSQNCATGVLFIPFALLKHEKPK